MLLLLLAQSDGIYNFIIKFAKSLLAIFTNFSSFEHPTLMALLLAVIGELFATALMDGLENN